MITANTQDELNQKKNNIIQLINQTPLNQYRWQIGSLGLEDYLFMLIQKHQLMFGFAESCSGGLVSHLMTNMPGVSKYFMGSVISYTNQVKQDELNVSSSTLKKYGAVSEEVAREMAIGLKEKFNLDMALSLTGIAGPGGGSEKTPVGTICYGLCLKDKVESFTLNLNGSRDIIKYRFAYRGLHLLRDLIIRELGE
jgi:nicotinamide-nucleotide amidase